PLTIDFGGWSADECAAAHPARDRLVPARLRRQRLEYLGTGPRTRDARASRRGGEGRAWRTQRAERDDPRRHQGDQLRDPRARSAFRAEPGKERTAVGPIDALLDATAGRRIVRCHSRPARHDDRAFRARGPGDWYAFGGNGARLLARLLLV